MVQNDLEKLNNPEMLAKFDRTINDLIIADSVGEARELALILESIFSRHPEFKKVDPALFDIYYNYLVAIKYVILFDLAEAEIIQLIRDRFDFVLDHPEYDLGRKIRYKIRDINSLAERDVFKGKLRQALLECKIPFNQGKIVINDLSQPATVANWLKDYHTKVGIDRADPLQLNEYLVNNPNVKLLSPAEKMKLKSLLNFFEDLKFSSREFPLFEESFAAILPSNELAIITNGQLEKVGGEILKAAREAAAVGAVPSEKNALKSGLNRDVLADKDITRDDLIIDKPGREFVPTLPELEQALKNYSPSSLEYKAINQEISRLRKKEARKIR